MEFLYRVDKETSLVVELMDIRDELNAIRTVLAQQGDVLGALGQLYQSRRSGYDFDDLDDPKPAVPSSIAGSGVPAMLPERPILQNQAQIRETMQIVEKNIGAVHDLLNYAKQVQRSLENLLNFKQLHTNTLEARIRRKRAEGAERSENVRVSLDGYLVVASADRT